MRGDSKTTKLRVRDLEVTFATDRGPLKAVDGVSLDLETGVTVGLVGESGCGKSMTALSLLRLVPPPGRITGGQVMLDGTDLLDIPESEIEQVRGRRISMIFQEPMTALNPVFTIGDQIIESLRIHRQANKVEARDAAIHMLERVGIPDPGRRMDAYPHHLSGGMRQRAMIAMALVCHPEILIADEPTTALDVTIQAQILDLMLEIQRDMGLAILFITHNLAVVSEVADRVIVMYAGRIFEHAPSDILFDSPLHPYTRGLIETIPGAQRQDRLPAISGVVPDPRNLPSGCRFSDRCPLADGECRAKEPPLEAVGSGHAVACWKAKP